jgi:hypothetical protein
MMGNGAGIVDAKGVECGCKGYWVGIDQWG